MRWRQKIHQPTVFEVFGLEWYSLWRNQIKLIEREEFDGSLNIEIDGRKMQNFTCHRF